MAMDVQGKSTSNRDAFPAQQAFAVTKSDSTLVSYRSIWFGGAAAANIAVVPLLSTTGAAVTFGNVQPGSILPIAVRKIMATNTTAADADMLGLT